MKKIISIDFETYCDLDLKQVGLDLYSSHTSCEVLMAAWRVNGGSMQHWTKYDGPFPRELARDLEDPEVERHAFNMQFERVIARRVLKLKVPYKNCRCTMVKAYQHSFTGTLDMVGRQMGMPEDKMKSDRGKQLIQIFCKPQRVTKNQPHVRRDRSTDPALWQEFCDYNKQDVVAEDGIWARLIKFPDFELEWELYELDQLINDRGFPIDRQFVLNAIEMSKRRKAELHEEMRRITSVANPNSTPQLLPWLKAHGYPFGDLQKNTVLKVLTEDEEKRFLAPTCREVLKLRQWAARQSVAKYDSLRKSLHANNRCRFGFQFAGASRTQRWSGRRFQPHNLPRAPRILEADKKWVEQGLRKDEALCMVTEAIQRADYDGLKLLLAEPMEGLVGALRSAIAAPEGKTLRVADLSSIETRVTAWISGCERLLRVVREGLDPYIDFATDLYSKAYDDVDKRERQDAKPAVLGCTYRLGGGDLFNGKRTGLWGYAESMGVNLTKQQANRSVTVFRSSYPEIPQSWYALENAFERCMKFGRPVQPKFRLGDREIAIPVTFEYRKPYLLIWLPSGRPIYYHLPRISKETRRSRPTADFPEGYDYEKTVFSYMGVSQVTKKWQRIETHGGKIIENIVQAIARDILGVGMLRAHKDGFYLIGHVHDELITEVRPGDNYYTHLRLAECMYEPISWCPGLPLGAAGYDKPFYRKD